MKVLMFGWEFPPHISGGLGTACFGLTKSMSQLGVDITFVLPKTTGDYSDAPVSIVGPKNVKRIKMAETTVEEEISTILKTYKVDSALHPYMDNETYVSYLTELHRKRSEGLITDDTFHSLEASGNYGSNLMTEVSRYAVVGKHIALQEDFEIIHAHDWMTYQAGIEAKKVSGKPLVVHVHATEFDRTSNNCNSEIYAIEKYGMDMADQIITVSKRTRDIVIEKYNQDPRKIKVVYNGVEKDDMDAINQIVAQSSFDKDRLVLFLGRITTQKGPEYFIHAANIVMKKMKNVRFIMAGSGDMTPEMIELMAKYRIADRFHFTGFLGPAQRENLFAISDIFIMPSVSEPFGIVPLEALKHKIPLIISKQSGVAEVLENVRKVDFWDVDKLAAEIVDLLEDPEYTKDLALRSFKELDGISWDKAADEVLGIYNNTLKQFQG
ncbi:MAG: glycosyltransferase family 4 protein [Bacteriovoracaceae bacterium]|nr:glycosyltransferase family 4 protein [Bacteriovoracaceae bacterium]